MADDLRTAALSDDEQNSASEDEIPLRGKAVAADDADVDEDDEGDEDDEDECARSTGGNTGRIMLTEL